MLQRFFAKGQLYAHLYARELSVLILCTSALFLGVCLWSYQCTDPSWFYFSTAIDPVGNTCGLIGSYIAALLYYLFGASSLLIVPLLFFIAYLLITKKTFVEHVDRVIAFMLLIVVNTTIMHLYRFDLNGAYPGGFVGVHTVRLLASFFDQFSMLIFMHTLLCVSLILLFRFSFIGLIHYMLQAIHFLTSQRFLRPIYRGFSMAVWVLIRPCVWLYNTIYGLCVTKTIHNKNRSILEFEYGIKQNSLKEDTFWQQYIDKTIGTSQQKPETVMISETNIESITGTQQEPSESIEDQYHYATLEQCTDIQQDESVLPGKQDQYILPSLSIFIGNDEERDDPKIMQYLQERAQILEQKLQRFGVSGQVVSIKRGPVVTLFEYHPEIDSKISKITALEDDLALALQALSIRIIAPIPGKPVVGFEVSNRYRKDVLLADVLRSDVFECFEGHLPLALGQDTIGTNKVVDLARMPHLLIAGSTGSGKSVALNAMLISLLCKLSPDELRLVLIDPKRLEFAAYADIAHLLFPIVTQPKSAAPVLKWIVRQMEERYEMMAKVGARNLHDYNILLKQKGEQPLPFIVVIIDELADLMMSVGREIEDLIARITQMARAAGIHLIVATQRPSVDVITGLIKVNFPSRISFRVTSKIDSRTILDCAGADKLLGRGDMLFLDSQDSSLKRLHGAYVADNEIEEVVGHIRTQREVQYLDLHEELEQTQMDLEKDELYDEILMYLDEIDEVSISLLQRKFRIGYNRSARIIEMLESQGMIGPSGNGKTRIVIRQS